jgi:bacterial/archaeal transporter family protein
MFWLVCAVYYALSLGALGITSTKALAHLQWYDLILWTAIGYALVAGFLLVTGHTAVRITSGSWWAILSAGLAITALISLYVGLTHGPAAKVVTIGAAYPAVTVLLAALFLSEPLTVPHVGGVLLIIAGGVLIAAF